MIREKNELLLVRLVLGTILLLTLLIVPKFSVLAKIDEEAVDKFVKKDITPEEPAGSDLAVVQGVTKLDSKRWIQSFAMDSRYYYFIQMTNPYKGHLRITRVKYTGLGKYLKDHMDLKYFGHGTNLDCSVYNGRTYLWTGCNTRSGSTKTRAISCFPYRKGAVLYHRGAKYYKIPKGKNGAYVQNVYPAVNQNSTRLVVRFTQNKKQYFQIYSLKKGNIINPKKPLRQVKVSKTAGDFQGFDLYGNKLYTIEGSPTKVFLKAYDKSRKFQPTIIRTINMAKKTQTKRVIRGAAKLPFREPEGIKVLKKGRIHIMFVSFRLTDQSCNIYKVR